MCRRCTAVGKSCSASRDRKRQSRRKKNYGEWPGSWIFFVNVSVRCEVLFFSSSFAFFLFSMYRGTVKSWMAGRVGITLWNRATRNLHTQDKKYTNTALTVNSELSRKLLKRTCTCAKLHTQSWSQKISHVYSLSRRCAPRNCRLPWGNGRTHNLASERNCGAQSATYVGKRALDPKHRNHESNTLFLRRLSFARPYVCTLLDSALLG